MRGHKWASERSDYEIHSTPQGELIRLVLPCDLERPAVQAAGRCASRLYAQMKADRKKVGSRHFYGRSRFLNPECPQGKIGVKRKFSTPDAL